MDGFEVQGCRGSRRRAAAGGRGAEGQNKGRQMSLPPLPASPCFTPPHTISTPRHFPPGHFVGGSYFPPGSLHGTLEPHFPHTNSISVQRGRVGLMRMTVPLMVTRWPAGKQASSHAGTTCLYSLGDLQPSLARKSDEQRRKKALNPMAHRWSCS